MSRKIYVVTGFRNLACVTVRKETEKSYLSEKVENLIGWTFASTSRFGKNNPGNSYHENIEDALAMMLDRITKFREGRRAYYADALATALDVASEAEASVREFMAILQEDSGDDV